MSDIQPEPGYATITKTTRNDYIDIPNCEIMVKKTPSEVKIIKQVRSNKKGFAIFDDNLAIYGEELLCILLQDRSSGKNIIWATNDYAELGEQYAAENEIKLETLNGGNEKLIKPRISKSYEKQTNRTKEKAEVFTPSWVCNKQNNLIDEQWFGREVVFNMTEGKTWIAVHGKIEFPDEEGKTWQEYIDARRMEITCGEAPYLVSRYDTVTGQSIDIESRIGLLDRKLRVVNENTDNGKDWLKWTIRAYESVYGFELQGDNLLLARENLLATFIDNMRYKLERDPSLAELKRIATIISWNIWQMDGLKYIIPFFGKADEAPQLTLFDVIDDIVLKPIPVFSKIKDWRTGKVIEYRSLLKRNRGLYG